jgi:hypothetical protein
MGGADMTTKFKLITTISALALAVPAAASAHHDDNDYGLVKMPTLKLIDFSPRPEASAPSQRLQAPQSPVAVTGPQVKIYRRTYVKGGSGLLGLKLSCKSIGLGCSGNVALGRNGRLGTRNFRLRTDAPQIVSVKISRGAVSKLIWTGKLSLGLKVRASDDAGNVSVTTGDLKLVPRVSRSTISPGPRL